MPILKKGILGDLNNTKATFYEGHERNSILSFIISFIFPIHICLEVDDGFYMAKLF